MTLRPEDRLVWVDIENTGLEVGKEALLEVGFMVTDLDLIVHNTFHALVWEPEHGLAIDNANQFVVDMHTKNNLFFEAQSMGSSLEDTELKLHAWFDEIEVELVDPLCGSSVQFDRAHLTYTFPTVMERFSYRNIDVSTVKELCRRYNPLIYRDMPDSAKKQHRVIPDIIDTLKEFRYYRDEFFLWKD